MECAKRGAANGHRPWQAQRQSRSPGKCPGLGLAQRGAGRGAEGCIRYHGAELVRLLPQAGLRLTGRSRATTFVARLATFRILPATRFTKDLIRGSLSLSRPAGYSLVALEFVRRYKNAFEKEELNQKAKMPYLRCLLGSFSASIICILKHLDHFLHAAGGAGDFGGIVSFSVIHDAHQVDHLVFRHHLDPVRLEFPGFDES